MFEDLANHSLQILLFLFKNLLNTGRGITRGAKGAQFPWRRIAVGTPNHCGGRRKVSPMSQVLFSTAHLLPKDLRFEHEGAKLVSCPGVPSNVVTSLATGVVPKPQLHSTVISVPKQSKPSNTPSSHRPILLTSNAWKIMEKMVVNRLKWYLEHCNLLHITQSGFCSRRQTTNHIMPLHGIINKTLANKNHDFAVFIDISKAYDMVCIAPYFLKLLKLGVNGRMIDFIRSFLTNRSFQVRVASSFLE